MNKLREIISCLFAIAFLHTQLAHSHGSLAVGVPESIVQDGIAVGFAWNAPDAHTAQVEALKSCLNLKTASARARALCSVVSTYQYRCFSVALDQPGGAGWAWAVERSSTEAEGKALQLCKSTVQKICTIAFTQCDESP
jgi:hypothetical protein